ncbi:hypothetical protein GCM10009682_37870 [Luedemannella flava]|uniref:Golgi apparatus membrane protein TVP23 homolog n=2 Tax=Luedemannella flava TaxID=349316 RepID=A0ABP4YH67_9ACTN
MSEDATTGRPLRDVGRLAVIVTARPVAAYLNSAQVRKHGKGRPAAGNRAGRPTREGRPSLPIHRFSAAGIREDARERPTTVTDAASCVGDRILAWVVLFLLSLPAYIVAAVLRSIIGYWLDTLLLSIMVTALCVGLFSSASVLVCVGRFTLIRLIGWRGFAADEFELRMRPRRNGAYVRGDGSRSRLPEETNGFVRWLCTPSHTDVIFPLLWTLMMAPVIITGIPR